MSLGLMAFIYNSCQIEFFLFHHIFPPYFFPRANKWLIKGGTTGMMTKSNFLCNLSCHIVVTQVARGISWCNRDTIIDKSRNKFYFCCNLSRNNFQIHCRLRTAMLHETCVAMPRQVAEEISPCNRTFRSHIFI